MGQLDIFPIAYVDILLTSYTPHIQIQVSTSSKTYPPMLCWLRVVRRHCLLFVWKMPQFSCLLSICVWHASIIACPANHLPVKSLPSEMGSLLLTLLSLRLIFPFSCISTSHPCDLILTALCRFPSRFKLFYLSFIPYTVPSPLLKITPIFKDPFQVLLFFHKYFLVLCIECGISFCWGIALQLSIANDTWAVSNVSVWRTCIYSLI